MEFSFLITVVIAALVQIIGIAAFIARNNRFLRSEVGDLHDQVIEHAASTRQLEKVVSGSLNETSSMNEVLQVHQNQLQELYQAISAYQKSLNTMERRLVDLDKVGDMFKSLFDEMPAAIEKYHRVMDKMAEEVNAELQTAEQNQDEALVRLQTQELESIEARKRLIDELPRMLKTVHGSLNPLNERLKLFTDRDKYTTAAILSHQARKAKSLLSAIGEQPFKLENMPASLPPGKTDTDNNGEVIIAVQESRGRKSRKKKTDEEKVEADASS